MLRGELCLMTMEADFRGLIANIKHVNVEKKRIGLISFINDFTGKNYSDMIYNLSSGEVEVLWDICIKTKQSLEAL
jgi:hypothetical protein